MEHNAIIQTQKLSKTFKGNIYALKDLTLDVQRGEIFGYLGPNGAGKTTTIKLLLDMIRPSAGQAQLFGYDVNRESVAVRARLGFLPAELNLWERQTAKQIIHYIGQVRGGVDQRYVHELAERLEFDLTKKLRSYSTGNKRKLGLILALMNKPELLILDEPTSGLDPLMQQIFNDLMREARDAGRTVFLSSHVLGEVQAICDRVGILRGGVLQSVQRVDSLTQADFRMVTIRFQAPVAAGFLTAIPNVTDVRVHNHEAKFQLHGDFDPVLRALSGHYITSMEVEKPTLEDIFLKFYNTDGGRQPQPA